MVWQMMETVVLLDGRHRATQPNRFGSSKNTARNGGNLNLREGEKNRLCACQAADFHGRLGARLEFRASRHAADA